MRICENCHGRDSLHNIQADSDGDNVIQPGIEQPFFGHIGNPDDCWGCHGFGPEELTAPETGAVVPSISSISNSVMTEGTDNTVTLSGAAFTNMDDGIELSSDVVLIASDGSTITLVPESISQDSIAVTIPNNLLRGNYKLKTAKLNKRSNPKVISIKPAVKITLVECMPRRGRLIIKGSGFDNNIEGADAYLNVKVNGKVAEIISWRNNRIKVSVSRCSDNDNVTVKALFGSATTDNAPLKPDKGR